MNTAAPPLAELRAPAHWQTVDFISDLHLQEAEPKSLALWERYMASTQASAIVILGDLFDVWVGDDALKPGLNSDENTSTFEAHCAGVLHAASQRCNVYLMHGNRDFLFGAQAAQTCGLSLLADPCVFSFCNHRWLLTHGDELCLDDVDYQKFRLIARSAPWQKSFLEKPLAERRSIAASLRAQSMEHQLTHPVYADVDTALALEWMNAARATDMIHGHTHRPAVHTLAPDRLRHVLSDWDGAATPPRMQVLRLSRTEADLAPSLQRLSLTDLL